MLYFSILVPLPAECSESVPSCNVSFAYTFQKFKCFAITYLITSIKREQFPGLFHCRKTALFSYLYDLSYLILT